MRPIAERHTICEHCLLPVKGVLYADADKVVLKKECPKCAQKTEDSAGNIIISSDSSYFLKSWINGQPQLKPKGPSALIIEVTDDCNLRCPTCIAGSEPGAGNTKEIGTVKGMIEIAERCSRKPDILMISGGEPTIHPNIIDILKAACGSSIPHVILITNGKRIAEDSAFADKLADLRNLEIYLQFDSLEPEVLKNLRGEDLSGIRRNAVASLSMRNVPTTLIAVVKQGLNEGLCGAVIRYGLAFKNIRGITFQPIRSSGRTESLTHHSQVIDLANVRKNIIAQSIGFDENNLLPHPISPETICIGYLHRQANELTQNAIDKVFGISPNQDKICNSLYFLPSHNSSELNYTNLFRVAIISFMDKYNFFRELIPYAAFGFILPNGLIAPLDTYYMFNKTGVSQPF